MEIKTELTQKDYSDFNKYYFKKRRLKKLIFLSAIISLILPFTFGNINNLKVFDFILSILIYNSVFFGIIIFNLNRTKKIPLKNGTFIGERRYIIQENDMICETKDSTTTIKWSGIKSVEIGPHSIYLFVERIAAFNTKENIFE